MRLVAAIVCALILFCFGTAPSHADKRVALIIGNGAYAHVPHLPNPIHDAEAVAAALKRIGFETIVGLDLSQAGMQDAAISFARAAHAADVALFYYSGHAMQYAGVNYLAPIDAQLHDEADLRRMARVDEILADLQQAKNLRILVLDSCRDNPLADQLKRSIGSTRSASIGQGLAKMESADGTIISYATQVGRTASDGAGRNSPYTGAFLNHIEDKEEIATVFHRIGANVYETTKGTQVPELSLSFFGEFYLNGKMQLTVGPPPVSAAPADPCAAAADHWKSAEAIGSIAAFEDHLDHFPNCAFAGLAKARIEGLKNKVATVVPALPPTPGGLKPPPVIDPAVVPLRPPVSSGLIFADSDRRRLAMAELSGRSAAELRIGRNEIFARRGRMFDSPDLQAHFAGIPWYRPRLREVQLSDIEAANVALFLEAEKRFGAATPASNAQARSDFIFPDSDRRLLTVADVNGLTRAQLRIARNEIFARRGRIFDSDDLRQRFESFPWYHPTSKNPSLNAIEQQNVDLIQRGEQRRP
jgi:hypothetical protein